MKRKRQWAAVVLPALAILAFQVVVFAGPQDPWKNRRGAERFAPIDWLVGEWQGYGQFTNRVTYIHKSFSYDVAGIFLVERTIDMFPPEEPSTDFEVHQDFTVYYRNTQDGSLRAKGFFVESFVTSANVGLADGGSTLIVEALAVENGPPGMKSRYTITRRAEDEFNATFELAMPGKDYKIVETLVMEKVR